DRGPRCPGPAARRTRRLPLRTRQRPKTVGRAAIRAGVLRAWPGGRPEDRLGLAELTVSRSAEHVARRDRGALAGRRRLEAYPAEAREVHLGPRVRVGGLDLVAAVLELCARRVADYEPGRDAEQAGQHGHRVGVLH